MTATDNRRMYLLDTVRNLGGAVTTKRALEIYAASDGWRGTGRNAARRDLRDLARRAYLIPDDTAGRRAYTVAAVPPRWHPFRGRSMRSELLAAIRREGGEWTAGRTKNLCRRTVTTHVWRQTARRYLAELHRLGHLDRHGDGTPRRFYTLATTTDGAS